MKHEPIRSKGTRNLWVASGPLLELGNLSGGEIWDRDRLVAVHNDGAISGIFGAGKVLSKSLARSRNVVDGPGAWAVSLDLDAGTFALLEALDGVTGGRCIRYRLLVVF